MMRVHTLSKAKNMGDKCMMQKRLLFLAGHIYCATCHSSLSAHSFFLSVNKTSETSLDPFPLKQLLVSKRHSLVAGKQVNSHDDILISRQGLCELHTSPQAV
jgi:hypothetical protein